MVHDFGFGACNLTEVEPDFVKSGHVRQDLGAYGLETFVIEASVG